MYRGWAELVRTRGRHARASRLGDLDYFVAQAHAAALVAAHCLELNPEDPLAAARPLRTTTVCSGFEFDPVASSAATASRSSAGAADAEGLLLADAA